MVVDMNEEPFPASIGRVGRKFGHEKGRTRRRLLERDAAGSGLAFDFDPSVKTE
jgi:hypothetical protein